MKMLKKNKRFNQKIDIKKIGNYTTFNNKTNKNKKNIDKRFDKNKNKNKIIININNWINNH